MVDMDILATRRQQFLQPMVGFDGIINSADIRVIIMAVLTAASIKRSVAVTCESRPMHINPWPDIFDPVPADDRQGLLCGQYEYKKHILVLQCVDQSLQVLELPCAAIR